MAIKQSTASGSAGLFYGHNAASDIVGPMTVFIWGRETATSQAQQQLLSKSSNSSATVNLGSWWLAWTNDGVGSGNNLEFVAEAFSTGIGVWAGDIITPDVGVWHNYGVTYAYGSAADVPIFYKDGKVITSAVVITPSGAILATETSPIVVGNLGDNVQGNQDWGLAHTAYWRAVLTPEEMRLLGSGVSPHLIRPDALIFYAPLGYSALDAYAFGQAQLGMPSVIGTWIGWADPPMMSLTRVWFDHVTFNPTVPDDNWQWWGGGVWSNVGGTFTVIMDATISGEVLSLVAASENVATEAFTHPVSDARVTLEAVVKVTGDEFVTLASGVVTRDDANVASESAILVTNDGRVTTESSGAVVSDARVALEALVKATTDSVVADESLVSGRNDANVGSEVAATARNDANVALESSGNVLVVNDAKVAFEVIASVSADSRALTESLVVTRDDAALAAEAASGLRTDASVPAEALAKVARDERVALEYSGALQVTSDAGIAFEIMTTAQKDASVAAESLTTTRTDATVPGEGVIKVTADRIAEIESLITTSANANVAPEASGRIVVDGNVLGEFKATMVKDANVAGEWRVLIVANEQIAFEYRGGIAVTNDARLAFEFLTRTQNDTTLTLEAAGALVAALEIFLVNDALIFSGVFGERLAASQIVDESFEE